jgi:hypothetical protein
MGPPGDAGVVIYRSRSELYCRSTTGIADAGNEIALRAFCDDAEDLPLSGACDGDVYPSDSILVRNTQLNWEQEPTASSAGWLCQWRNLRSRMDQLSAHASICCIRRP